MGLSRKMNKAILLAFSMVVLTGCSSEMVSIPRDPPVASLQPSVSTSEPLSTAKKPVQQSVSQAPKSYEIDQKIHTFQSFNNCGPATYSMALSYQNISAPQAELGKILRPYQIQSGDNDDKSVRIEEIAEHAETEYGLNAYYRPNGTIALLKEFISRDIPVVLRVWLNDTEDIGHYIIVRGYDDSSKQIIFDDSYYGPNRRVGYETLNRRWESFLYSFLVLGSDQKTSVIEGILGEMAAEQTAWQQLLTRTDGYYLDMYRNFNQSVAYYYLGDYKSSIATYESIATELPGRMLWYHLEPIWAYEKAGNSDKVFSITNNILNKNNRAFSELYVIRARMYIADGNVSAAKNELDLAIRYNQNYLEAKRLRDAL